MSVVITAAKHQFLGCKCSIVAAARATAVQHPVLMENYRDLGRIVVLKKGHHFLTRHIKSRLPIPARTAAFSQLVKVNVCIYIYINICIHINKQTERERESGGKCCESKTRLLPGKDCIPTGHTSQSSFGEDDI